MDAVSIETLQPLFVVFCGFCLLCTALVVVQLARWAYSNGSRATNEEYPQTVTETCSREAVLSQVEPITARRQVTNNPSDR